MTHRENFAECIPRKIGKLEKTTLKISEIVIHEKIRLVCLLDLTADFGVKTNADLTPISKRKEVERNFINWWRTRPPSPPQLFQSTPILAQKQNKGRRERLLYTLTQAGH